jgi:hypothetical protein
MNERYDYFLTIKEFIVCHFSYLFSEFFIYFLSIFNITFSIFTRIIIACHTFTNIYHIEQTLTLIKLATLFTIWVITFRFCISTVYSYYGWSIIICIWIGSWWIWRVVWRKSLVWWIGYFYRRIFLNYWADGNDFGSLRRLRG